MTKKKAEIAEIIDLTPFIACTRLCCKLYRQSHSPYGETTDGFLKWVKEQLSSGRKQ